MALASFDISRFAHTNSRAQARNVGIKQSDRLSHLYAIGKTGVGKSSLLECLVSQDLTAGRGFALIDPHGDLVERVSAEENERVVYLDATDPSQPFGYNPLRRVRDDKIPLAASGLVETLKKLWPDAWGVRIACASWEPLRALGARRLNAPGHPPTLHR